MFSSTVNNQSLFTKSRGALLFQIELLGKKEEKGNIFSNFTQKIRFDISCKLSPLETIHMKCHWENKKNLINLSSSESAHSVVSNNSQMSVPKEKGYKIMLF